VIGATDEAGEVDPGATSVVGSIGVVVETGVGWLEVVNGPVDPAVVATDPDVLLAAWSLDAHPVPTIAPTAITRMTIATLRLGLTFMTPLSLRIAISRRNPHESSCP
jgi:hypothetical protein